MTLNYRIVMLILLNINDINSRNFSVINDNTIIVV